MATPAVFEDTIARATRTTEVADADWDNGMNYGSCNPGIGIALGGEINLTGESNGWTLLDQGLSPDYTAAARTPQDGQSIGGVGLNAGVTTASTTPFLMVTALDDDGLGGLTLGLGSTLTTLAAGWVAAAV